MFVRKKLNKSNVVSVQVIDKSSGKYKLVKTIGSSNNALEIDKLFEDGKKWVLRKSGVVEFDFIQIDNLFETFIDGICSIYIVGTELLLGKIFDEIGFNKIQDALFRKLVLARLCYPLSKLKTTEYLSRYEGFITTEDKIYRYLDKLHSTQKKLVQQISYAHTLKILNHVIQVVFYDVTTLYFEIKEEDTIRKTGFSKDGKHQNPQIVLGLLVSEGGYPLAYEIYEGNKYEGDTMMPILNHFKRIYKLEELIVVADAGLLSSKNIESLELNGYKYILGGRIKNESNAMKNKILSLTLQNGESAAINKTENTKIIISYSDARAKKDKHNRDKGIQKLEQQIKTNKLTKSHINNKGYNKYLKLVGDVKISLDKSKVNEDSKWDGLKGFVTNTTLSKEEIIENYGHLWRIEKAFRVAKSDLLIRPIYHQLQRRIEAHICIAFVAYKIYKELERQLKNLNSELSPEKAIEIAKSIYSITAQKPFSKQIITRVIYKTDEQKKLANLFDF